jgi:hypothetical protein
MLNYAWLDRFNQISLHIYPEIFYDQKGRCHERMQVHDKIKTDEAHSPHSICYSLYRCAYVTDIISTEQSLRATFPTGSKLTLSNESWLV